MLRNQVPGGEHLDETGTAASRASWSGPRAQQARAASAMTISPAAVRRAAAAASDRRGAPIRLWCGGNRTGRRSDQTAAWLAAGVDADHLRETAGALLRVVDLEGGRGAWHSWDVLAEKSASARSAPRAQVLRRPPPFFVNLEPGSERVQSHVRSTTDPAATAYPAINVPKTLL